MIKETESFNGTFWSDNHPVGLDKDKETGEVTFIVYSPRKQRIYDSSENGETIPKEEVEQFCDNSITKLKEAIQLFEKFKAGEINNIYYWDIK